MAKSTRPGTSNATANAAGTTQLGDGCVVPSQTGRMVTCEHGPDVPDHIAARQGTAGHQRQ
ncbi:hypothetical protein OOJ91_33580 [Micromonospora lupini]|uniref:hypothetical protein n=1 Tax=Micromonospora lupini TaxID=285679 RepID=UPI0022577DC3|nr:hypothetical protein [Micromonospora lupini]MCX5070778.1 hypothetical protein [Micromonospora lupini]